MSSVKHVFVEHVNLAMMSKHRVLEILRWNGRDTIVAAQPYSKDLSSFLDQAKRTGWIEFLLPKQHHKEGMLKYLMDKHFQENEEYINKEIPKKIDTFYTLSIKKDVGLGKKQLEKLVSVMKHNWNVHLQCSTRRRRFLDKQLRLDEEQLKFGKYTFKTKEGSERCEYYTSNVLNDISRLIDIHLIGKRMRDFDYNGSPLNYKTHTNEFGIDTIVGGDHGKRAFRLFLKLNLSSPETRKEKQQISFDCPMVQIAYIECSKSNRELLENTIMKDLNEQLEELENKKVVLVYTEDEYGALNQWTTYVVPKTCNISNCTIDQDFVIDMGDDLKINLKEREIFMNCQSSTEFTIREIVHNFELFVLGDLEFECQVMGMNKSDGKHCMLCATQFTEFNYCRETIEERQRTTETMKDHYKEYEARKINKPDLRNYKGVNGKPLLPIDPRNIIIPILHCPMGLVEKIYEQLLWWIFLCCMKIDDANTNTKRMIYRTYKREVKNKKPNLILNWKKRNKTKTKLVNLRKKSNSERNI